MKIIVSLLLSGCVAIAGPQPNWQSWQALRAENEFQAQQAAATFAPPDRHLSPPNIWRAMNGFTNCIAGPGWKDFFFPDVKGQWEMRGYKPPLAVGWVIFGGKVLEVQPRGIRIRGYSSLWETAEERVFFIKNYPYPVEEGAMVLFQAARDDGTYTYSTVSGSSATIHSFDYGRVCDPPVAAPPTEAQLNAAREQAAKKKAAAAEGALKYNQELADRGDSYGELRMGERYRDGEGVPRDLQRAREWFSKAAAQGDKAAANELAALPAN